MGVAGEHYDALDAVSAHFEFNHFVGAFLALLYQAVAADNAASYVRKMNLAEYLEKGIVK